MNDRLLKINEVKSIISMGDSWIYEKMNKGEFPKPIKLSSRCVRWRQSDVNRWIAEQSPLEETC